MTCSAAARRAAGLSQCDLAELLGVAQPAVSSEGLGGMTPTSLYRKRRYG